MFPSTGIVATMRSGVISVISMPIFSLRAPMPWGIWERKVSMSMRTILSCAPGVPTGG